MTVIGMLATETVIVICNDIIIAINFCHHQMKP